MLSVKSPSTIANTLLQLRTPAKKWSSHAASASQAGNTGMSGNLTQQWLVLGPLRQVSRINEGQLQAHHSQPGSSEHAHGSTAHAAVLQGTHHRCAFMHKILKHPCHHHWTQQQSKGLISAHNLLCKQTLHLASCRLQPTSRPSRLLLPSHPGQTQSSGDARQETSCPVSHSRALTNLTNV